MQIKSCLLKNSQDLISASQTTCNTSLKHALHTSDELTFSTHPMKTAFANGFRTYDSLFIKHGVYFIKNEKWLQSVLLLEATTFTIVITAITTQAFTLLDALLPLINKLSIPFRIVGNELYHYQLNGGHFGPKEIGRFCVLFPDSQLQAQHTIDLILPITAHIQGPAVSGCKRITNSVYTSASIKYQTPEQFTKHKSMLLKKKYLPVGTIHKADKGDIRVAFYRKGLLPEPVIIKQGRWNMFDDDHARTIRDRMLWEQQTLNRLHGLISVPKALDFFDDTSGSNLVLNFVPGHNLYPFISRIFAGGRTWIAVPADKKKMVLQYYLSCVCLIEQLHELGYIHRDINHRNFIAGPTGKLTLIDFELSFSIDDQLPDPAFILGTQGFAAPEQKSFAIPAITEDIYSLGALLFYFTCGHHPINFMDKGPEDIYHLLLDWGVSNELAEVVQACMQYIPAQRPATKDIAAIIKKHITIL